MYNIVLALGVRLWNTIGYKASLRGRKCPTLGLTLPYLSFLIHNKLKLRVINNSSFGGRRYSYHSGLSDDRRSAVHVSLPAARPIKLPTGCPTASRLQRWYPSPCRQAKGLRCSPGTEARGPLRDTGKFRRTIRAGDPQIRYFNIVPDSAPTLPHPHLGTPEVRSNDHYSLATVSN